MTELKQGRIYKIISDSTDKIYVGSTYTNLAQRLAQHRAQYKQYINEKAEYMTSFELIKNGNCNIVLIESFDCNSREQLRAREAYWIKELKDQIVNKCIPNRTSLDYYYDNKEKVAQYYQDNKEKKIEYQKQWTDKNKDKLELDRLNYKLQKLNLKQKKYQERYLELCNKLSN